jgi:N-methylhydantoinase A
MSLDAGRAHEAIRQRIAAPLGMGVAQAAAGIHAVVNNRMADQIRLVSVFRGCDPRRLSLVAFGGAGPIAAGRLVQILDMKECLVPRSPGVLSAFGLLIVETEHEEVRSLRGEPASLDPEAVRAVLRELRARCAATWPTVGTSAAPRVRCTAEMRYRGQAYELDVPFPADEAAVTQSTLTEAAARFHEAHRRIYQHALPDFPVEFVAFRLAWAEPPAARPGYPRARTGPWGEPRARRPVYFEEGGRSAETPVYDRATLVEGQVLRGPAVVEQPDTTTVVYPGQRAEVDTWDNLVLRGEPAGE